MCVGRRTDEGAGYCVKDADVESFFKKPRIRRILAAFIRIWMNGNGDGGKR